ncbi:electron transport complex subunit RsxG [endosymbiont of Ridgeia piscesae]|uniref:Ion-translocating oxidoreductase complex subunit G n=2 Tax=endosymbiont of Ridgeia piscesae TaxID=54398 RepID=A0A0T5Z0D1_9GAMM|nr:electron transport complex subunit RsxG [endosymbiont of Ridgeia piscesae]KRT56362.1 electron transport complex, RnfABCDGE type, G subunit [endosymbiont of Ridgeia piscesae]
MTKHPVVIAGFVLAMFAVAGTALVSFTHQATKARIASNERQALLRSLTTLVPAASIDNDIISDVMTVSDPELLGSENTTVYRGRSGGQPVAVVLTPVVPNGYSGPIKLLVAVRYDGTLGGVRIISHKETPGLGDKIEESRSDWIYSFTGKSLNNPPKAQWGVKKDGGVFDQFTGATITPRSIVAAVKKSLLYVQQHQQQLYDRTPLQEATPGENNDG